MTAIAHEPQIQPAQGDPNTPKYPFAMNCPEAPVIVRQATQNGTFFTTFIDGVIASPEFYVELLHELYTATEQDHFTFILNTPGGCVNTGCEITSAMAVTKADTTTIANGACASCGAFIWSLGKNLIIRPWGSIMYHSSSHLDWNKSSAVLEHAENVLIYIEYLYSGIIKRGLLTEDEYLQLSDLRRDVYIDAATMNQRIKAIAGGN